MCREMRLFEYIVLQTLCKAKANTAEMVKSAHWAAPPTGQLCPAASPTRPGGDQAAPTAGRGVPLACERTVPPHYPHPAATRSHWRPAHLLGSSTQACPASPGACVGTPLSLQRRAGRAADHAAHPHTVPPPPTGQCRSHCDPASGGGSGGRVDSGSPGGGRHSCQGRKR